MHGLTAEQATDLSSRENRIVRLECTPELTEDLLALCDDSADVLDEHQYWGTTDSGAEWRVHLVAVVG